MLHCKLCNSYFALRCKRKKERTSQKIGLLPFSPLICLYFANPELEDRPGLHWPAGSHRKIKRHSGISGGKMAGTPPEGYLYKKPALNRWLKRYYVYQPNFNRLSYWKAKKDYNAGQQPKGSFTDATLLRVYHPDRSNVKLLNMEFIDKTLVLKAETEPEAKRWVEFMSGRVPSEDKSNAQAQAIVYDEEEMMKWREPQIVEMMANGMRMTAYFANETCKQFKLYCRDQIMYACPVSAGIEKAIIQFPLRRISDIYVGKQTPGFDTDIAFPVPFENCFTVISNQYTLDVAAQSPLIANHWLNGIKYLLTQSGKAVIINENEEDDEEGMEDPDGPEAHDAAAAAAAASPAAAAPAAAAPAQEEAYHEPPPVDPEAEAAAAEAHDGGHAYDVYETRLRRTALIIVDVQNDLLPGGPVALPGADAVIPVINELRNRCTWDLVLLTQNWRPENHCCFYETNKANPKAKLGRALEVNGKLQIMWPVHCVANTEGAQFPKSLDLEDTDLVIRKATTAQADTLSCFRDQDLKKTSLEAVLAQHAIDDVFLVGIGLDTVIGNTALEGQGIHYNVFVVEDGCKAFSEPTKTSMKKRLRAGGVPVINAKDIPDDSLMSDELVQEARAEMELDDDADSGDEGAHTALSPSAFAAAPNPTPASDEAGSPTKEEKAGSKKGAKKGSKKAAGVRIVAGTKKTASGKTVTKGTKSALAKGAKKAGLKKGAKKGSKKAAPKKPASKKAAAAKKPASKKPASKKDTGLVMNSQGYRAVVYKVLIPSANEVFSVVLSQRCERNVWTLKDDTPTLLCA
eukprot:g12212.t1